MKLVRFSKFLVGGLALAAAFFSVKSMARASYQQAPYEVVERLGKLEIRQYRPFITASVETDGEFRDSMNSGFRRLAAFIFGKNEQSQKIAMTAPVLFEAPEQGEASRMSFMVPLEYRMEDLPTPLDAGIVFEQQPAKLMAALRFPGKITEELWVAQRKELLNSLKGTDYEPVSEVLFYGYDPPAIPGPLRRNEVVVEVRHQP